MRALAPSTEPAIEPRPPTTIIDFWMTIWKQVVTFRRDEVEHRGIEPAGDSRGRSR